MLSSSLRRHQAETSISQARRCRTDPLYLPAWLSRTQDQVGFIAHCVYLYLTLQCAASLAGLTLSLLVWECLWRSADCSAGSVQDTWTEDGQ